MTTEEVQKLCDKVQGFVNKIASAIKVKPPKLQPMYLAVNKYQSKPSIRGMFIPDKNILCIDPQFPFKNEEDCEKCIRHEIAEWIEYLVIGIATNRRIQDHSDPIFVNIRKLVQQGYPSNPNKIIDFIKSRKK